MKMATAYYVNGKRCESKLEAAEAYAHAPKNSKRCILADAMAWMDRKGGNAARTEEIRQASETLIDCNAGGAVILCALTKMEEGLIFFDGEATMGNGRVCVVREAD